MWECREERARGRERKKGGRKRDARRGREGQAEGGRSRAGESRLKRSGPSARKQIKRPNRSTSADTLHQLGSSSNKKAAAFARVIFLIHSFREVLLVLVDFLFVLLLFLNPLLLRKANAYGRKDEPLSGASAPAFFVCELREVE